MPNHLQAECHDPVCFLNATVRDSLANFTAYNARFKMPSGLSDGNSNMWYSFNAGPVHFISFDLETAFPGAAEEKRYVFPSGGFFGNMTVAINKTKHAIKHTSSHV